MDIFNKKRVKALEQEIWKLKREIGRLDQAGKENIELNNKVSSLEQELSAIRTQVRTQTEADLYFECEKIKRKLIEGKKKEELQPQIAHMNILQQLARQQETTRQQQQNPLLSAFGL